MNTALVCGFAGLIFFLVMMNAGKHSQGEPAVGMAVAFWLNLFLQPLCLGAVWLRRNAPRNLAFRVLVWIYIVAGAAYIVFPVGLGLLKQ
ncbi:MAG: hypothetical protein MUC87_05630 [Bacteroidia bacterium]|nr:hypothetical protein [Bacteroidia bacterium]